MKLIKRIFAFILLISCIFGITACSDSTSDTTYYEPTYSGSTNSNPVEYVPPREIKDQYTFDVRTSTATINDNGREKNIIDHIPLSNYFSISDLKNSGYQTLKVTVTLQVKEQYDGYQYIFFYKDTSCNTRFENAIDGIIGGLVEDSSLITTHKFEYGAGKKVKVWGTEKFTVYIPVSSLKKDLYLRYGASGTGDDTWYNKNVTVQIEPQ